MGGDVGAQETSKRLSSEVRRDYYLRRTISTFLPAPPASESSSLDRPLGDAAASDNEHRAGVVCGLA